MIRIEHVATAEQSQNVVGARDVGRRQDEHPSRTSTRWTPLSACTGFSCRCSMTSHHSTRSKLASGYGNRSRSTSKHRHSMRCRSPNSSLVKLLHERGAIVRGAGGEGEVVVAEPAQQQRDVERRTAQLEGAASPRRARDARQHRAPDGQAVDHERLRLDGVATRPGEAQEVARERGGVVLCDQRGFRHRATTCRTVPVARKPTPRHLRVAPRRITRD